MPAAKLGMGLLAVGAGQGEPPRQLPAGVLACNPVSV